MAAHDDDDSPHGLRTGPLDGPARLEALSRATAYRGDVTLYLDDGSTVTGYLFALDLPRMGSSAPATARLVLKGSDDKHSVVVDRIAEIEFSGEDTAAGKSWRAWQERHRAIQQRVGLSGAPNASASPAAE